MMRERYFAGADVFMVRADGDIDYVPVTLQEAAELASLAPDINYFAIYRYEEK